MERFRITFMSGKEIVLRADYFTISEGTYKFKGPTIENFRAPLLIATKEHVEFIEFLDNIEGINKNDPLDDYVEKS